MANACILKLQTKLDTARLLLGVTEIAREMETETEKVQPFAPMLPVGLPSSPASVKVIADYNEEEEEGEDESTVSAPASKQTHVNVLQAAVCSKEGSFVNHGDRLSNFYLKYNRILLDTINIDKEKERLSVENSQLEDLIKQFLDGTKLDENTLLEDNPLFVVNGR